MTKDLGGEKRLTAVENRTIRHGERLVAMEGLAHSIDKNLSALEKNHIRHIEDNMKSMHENQIIIMNDNKWVKKLLWSVLTILVASVVSNYFV